MREYVPCNLCAADDRAVVYVHPNGRIANGVCRSCGLAYLSPRPNAAASASLYRVYQQAYPQAVLLAPGNPFDVVAHERAAFAARWLAPHSYVTELGCSYGHFAAALGKCGHRVRGLDVSIPQLTFARERLDVDATEGAVEDIETDERADLVAMFHVIEHLRDPLAALGRIRRHLRPGGLLLLDLPNAQRLPHDAIEHLYVASGQHLYAFTPTVLEKALGASGFEILYLAHHPLPAVYEANLRAVARRTGHVSTLKPDAASVSKSLRALRRYHAGIKDLGVRARSQIEAWRAEGRRVALYGAGFHTRGLIDLCALTPEEICLIVDDDPAKHRMNLEGIPVSGPNALRRRNIGGVLVSTLASETTVARRLRGGTPRGLRVATLYNAIKTSRTKKPHVYQERAG